jgi:MFS transporter, SP family, solute carrier family 2 (myo-inositol transporter), member 13
MSHERFSPDVYQKFLLAITGLGGLLYGIDVGIIAAALLYLTKTVYLTISQTSLIVAAVLGGSMLSSLIAGVMADSIGRRRMMILSGCMFSGSVACIAFSHGFAVLFAGRLLQGMSGGVIAVVIPLYLAETLRPESRGKGTAIFQFMVTFGVVVASAAGWFYTHKAEAAIRAAAGNQSLIRAVEDHAWRSMFLVTIVPGLIYLAGTLLLVETPRWLFRAGRTNEAYATLLRLNDAAEADLQLAEMKAQALDRNGTSIAVTSSLLQKKYVVPFVLACIVLACNQACGINSILGFLVVILKQAGLGSSQATQGDVVVKVLHCLATSIAVLLVDKKGRVFLLKVGTAGMVCSLVASALLFYSFEAKRSDVSDVARRLQSGVALTLPINALSPGQPASDSPMVLTILYSYGEGDRIATALSTDADQRLSIAPRPEDRGARLVIRRAFYGPVASTTIGWLTMVCLASFVCFFSLGPGVVVWLALSELMPTRIRSRGMGIALFLNQGVSTLIAALFLPVAGSHGYYAVFLFWAASAVVYLITATFFLPETKGKTLEEIETLF